MQFTRAVLGLLGAASLAAALPPVTVKGNYFVNNVTGDRFQIAGVAYQPGGSSAYSPNSGQDPLSDKSVCLRDVAIMQALGVNAIRVYSVNPDLNHDDCVSILNAAGIFVFLDVNSPLDGESINPFEPWTTYNAHYLNHTFAVVEAFKDYPNTAGFIAGNEVIGAKDTMLKDPPYMRAVTRDLKNYIAKHSTRAIPVGYAATDVREILFDTWAYLQCADPNEDASRVDFFALNAYSWCGNSSFETSTYDQLVDGFQNSSVPVFFSEYGCIVPYPRVFTEVPEIYSDQMSGVFSGGVAYEFTEGDNNYGLVNVSTDGTARLIPDYYTLKDQLASLDWTSIQGKTPPADSPQPPRCSSSLLNSGKFSTDFALPILPPGAQDLINNGVSSPRNGKIVTIDNYTSPYLVEDQNGNVIAGLEVKPLANDQINQPGPNNEGTGSSSGSGTAGSPSETATDTAAPSATSSKAAAAGIRLSQGGTMLSIVAFSIAASFLVGLTV